MLRTITIKDFKCPSWNTYYAGVHWAMRKKKMDEIHELVYWAAHSSKIEPCVDKISILFKVNYSSKRRHDPDNCCVKPFVDGLVKAGILKDDSTKEIESITINCNTEQETNEVIIDIYEI